MATERPAKRVKLLASDDEGSDSDSSTSGGAPLNKSADLSVNAEFARRFEHNQKRKEQHRLEEKYGNGAQDESDDSSSSDEEEDDNALLASGALDDQFQATLNALRAKDPNIYKKDVKFYDDEADEDAGPPTTTDQKKEKPMYLADYHRQNLLEHGGDVVMEESSRPTFAQEQEAIRKSVVSALHADPDSDEDGNEEFLVASRVEQPESSARRGKAAAASKPSAEKDPEAFLDDFLSRRAWVPTATSKYQALESDDEDFDQRAENFEHEYNLRFESGDGDKSQIKSYGRDIIAKYTVRQDASTKRQRAREFEKERKAAAKQERHEEKSRLKKLKLDEAEEKLQKIKQAAGLKGKEFDMDEWSSFLTGDWDEDKWEKEFEKRFGDDYYAEDDDAASDEGEGVDGPKKKKSKKPKFDDDIDVTDLIPDYKDEDSVELSLSEGDEIPAHASEKPKKKAKDHKKDREAEKREARRERRKLEALVDAHVDSDLAITGAGAKKKPDGAGTFRYRETSPTAYGLTSNEILMASDAQLNSLVGLKKLATFRDEDKKRKDKKRLGKKARLRQWRKDTFGNENGPQKTLQDVLQDGGVE